MDIDPERLDYIKRAIERIVAEGKYPAKVVATPDRAEAYAISSRCPSGPIGLWRPGPNRGNRFESLDKQ